MAAKIQKTFAVSDKSMPSLPTEPLDEEKAESEPTATGLAKTATDSGESAPVESEEAVKNIPEGIDVPGAFPEPNAPGEAELEDANNASLADKAHAPSKLDAVESVPKAEEDEVPAAVKESVG
jgi:hypothetical protein